MNDNNKFETKSTQLLKKFNLFSVPINLKHLTEALGITIEQKDLDNSISGFLVRKSDSNVIGLNKNHPDVRKRFTISHEIGHFELHKDQFLFVDHYKGAYLYRSDNIPSDYQKEKEANSYAAALLMPKELVETELINLSPNLNFDMKIDELSKNFRVSKQAMEFRLSSLGYSFYGL